MKKIYLSLMLLGAVAFTSCDMNTTPWGVLDEGTAIQTPKDLRKFRNQLYANLRGVTSGSWIYSTDIQMDEFIGLISNGNQLGEFSKGTFTVSDGSIEGFWGSGYAFIANCNALLAQADKQLAKEGLTDAEKLQFERYKGEAEFMRAYMYFWLADHFCQSYTQTDPNKAASGMPLVTVYNPTGDVKLYPGRSTLAETFSLIEDDLNKSLELIKAYENSGLQDEAESKVAAYTYVTSGAVEALQARVALVKGDWKTASTKAVSVIESHKYSLATPENYAEMWSDDVSTETILQPIQTPTELGGTYDGLYQDKSGLSAYYIPTYGALAIYGDGDIRFDAFFTDYSNLTVSGSVYPAMAFNKYPGNTALRTTSDNNFANMIKVFRLSEMYLIAAEAYARQGDNTNGSNYLNEFCKNRIMGYEAQTYPVENLLSTTLEERQKEFMGEGMRWSDIRRIGKGFTRNSDYPDDIDYSALNGVMVTLGRNLKYSATDYRLTWPIPKAELDANPQLAGQQNPGY